MPEIGAFEARNTLGALLDRVEPSEEVVITRHGKAVARLTSATGGIDHAQAASAARRMRERAGLLKSFVFDWPALKANRDQGRP